MQRQQPRSFPLVVAVDKILASRDPIPGVSVQNGFVLRCILSAQQLFETTEPLAYFRLLSQTIVDQFMSDCLSTAIATGYAHCTSVDLEFLPKQGLKNGPCEDVVFLPRMNRVWSSIDHCPHKRATFLNYFCIALTNGIRAHIKAVCKDSDPYFRVSAGEQVEEYLRIVTLGKFDPAALVNVVKRMSDGKATVTVDLCLSWFDRDVMAEANQVCLSNTHALQQRRQAEKRKADEAFADGVLGNCNGELGVKCDPAAGGAPAA